MNRRSKPRCVCAPDCSNITWKGPVCGSDGKTYKDECALLKAKCKGHPDLDVQYQGKCKSKTHFNSCDIAKYTCKHFSGLCQFLSCFVWSLPLSFVLLETCRDVLCPGSSTCVVDQTNNAYCVTCNRICPEVTSPEQYLCGNDGIIYASACHLRRATCLLGRSIGVAYEGKCISKSTTRDQGVRDFTLWQRLQPLNIVSVHSLPGWLCSYSLFTFCQHSTEEWVLKRECVW